MDNMVNVVLWRIQRIEYDTMYLIFMGLSTRAQMCTHSMEERQPALPFDPFQLIWLGEDIDENDHDNG